MKYVISLLWVLVASAQPAQARDLVVFAAASLKEPLDRIAAEFGNVTVSYGGSGGLARQIGFGAPADVVLLAHVTWMDVLVEDADVDVASVRDFVSNKLVLIAPKGNEPVALTADALGMALEAGPLAMGFTASVPAGIYGKAALTSLGLWGAVAEHVAEVDNVRAALALVARGEAPLGVVYRSDARVSDMVAIVADFPPESYPSIRYVGAITQASDHPQAAAFLDQLVTSTTQESFAAAGFCPLEGGC